MLLKIINEKLAIVLSFARLKRVILALLNQDMNTNRASYPQVSLVLGFKNRLEDNSYLKSATPFFLLFSTWYFTFGRANKLKYLADKNL
jgi:hypothetical protein